MVGRILLLKTGKNAEKMRAYCRLIDFLWIYSIRVIQETCKYFLLWQVTVWGKQGTYRHGSPWARHFQENRWDDAKAALSPSSQSILHRWPLKILFLLNIICVFLHFGSCSWILTYAFSVWHILCCVCLFVLCVCCLVTYW